MGSCRIYPRGQSLEVGLTLAANRRIVVKAGSSKELESVPNSAETGAASRTETVP